MNLISRLVLLDSSFLVLFGLRLLLSKTTASDYFRFLYKRDLGFYRPYDDFEIYRYHLVEEREFETEFFFSTIWALIYWDSNSCQFVDHDLWPLFLAFLVLCELVSYRFLDKCDNGTKVRKDHAAVWDRGEAGQLENPNSVQGRQTEAGTCPSRRGHCEKWWLKTKF